MSGIGTYQPRPVGFDMDGPTRFGNAPSFDPQMFPTAKVYIEALLAGSVRPPTRRSTSPTGSMALPRKPRPPSPSSDRRRNGRAGRSLRYAADIEIMAAIGRFFAQKFRSACYAE